MNMKSLKMRHKSLYPLIAALTLFAGAGVIYMNSVSAQDTAPKKAAALTVDTAAARMVERPDIIHASGPIVAWQEAIIGAEISGQRMTELLVDVGDVVTRGQILARYNPDTIRAEEAELKAAYAQASADRKRALALKGSGAMSVQQIDSFIAQANMAKARLDAKTLQLRYTDVTAPDDGVISSRTATLGAVGSVGEELFRLIRQNRIEWRGELTASQLALAAVGQDVDITLPDGDAAQGTIRQIAPSLNPDTRMATIYADIKDGSAARAGMYGDGRIKRAGRATLVVPSKAVVIRDGYSFVFTLKTETDGTTKALRQKVSTGLDQQGLMEITDGLAEGDTVAVQGAGFLNDGDIVRIAPDKKQTAPQTGKSQTP